MLNFWTKHWSYLALPIMLSVVAFAYVSPALDQRFFCAGQDSCFREWVGALSGWVAAVMAGLTILPLYRQLQHQQRQTDFQLGDSQPSFDAVQHTEKQYRVVIRIRNWNMRSMIIRRITMMKPANIDSATLYLFFDPQKYPTLAQKFGSLKPSGETTRVFEPALLLEGWVDRDEPAELLKFGISAYVNPENPIARWEEFPLELEYELAGDTQRRTLRTNIHTVVGASERDADVMRY